MKRHRWNFLDKMFTCHDTVCSMTCISWIGGLGRFGFPPLIVSNLLIVNINKFKGCHDANMNAKSGKIIHIFQYQTGAVTCNGYDVAQVVSSSISFGVTVVITVSWCSAGTVCDSMDNSLEGSSS